jgi:uncharacterized protein (DUF2384 family)
MPRRTVRDPHPLPEGEAPISMNEIIELAMECFGWPKAKVMSWYQKENPRLKKSRPSELVDRNQGRLVVEFLESRRVERINNEHAAELRKKQ